MQTLFQLAILALGVFLILRTLPLLLELLGLSLAALLPPRRLPAPTAAQPFQLCAVLPAHNEEKLIASAVRSLLEADTPPARVLVVAHNCSDATADRAEAAGAEVLRLNESSGGGKGVALFNAFKHALGTGADAVLVIDADSRVSPTLPGAVADAFAAGSQAVQARYVVSNAAQNQRTRLMSLAFYGMNVLRPRGRSRLGLSCGIFGNGFALSRQTLARVPYTAHSVVEDLEYHLKLMEAGIRVDFLDWTDVRGEMPDNARAAESQRARWEGGRELIRRQWRMPVLRMILRGHVRLLEPLLDLLAPPLATFALMLVVLLALPSLWLRLYAATGFAAIALYLLTSALLSESPAATLQALLFAPAFVLQKLAGVASKRRASQKGAAWVRTDRNETT